MRKIFIAAFLSLSLAICGCSNKPKTENVTPKISTNPTTPPISPEQRLFTTDTLKKYNGQNGNPVYIAVDGIVYDVTNVAKWKNGSHQGVTAGSDISQNIKSSPHGKDILKNIPVVGTFKK